MASTSTLTLSLSRPVPLFLLAFSFGLFLIAAQALGFFPLSLSWVISLSIFGVLLSFLYPERLFLLFLSVLPFETLSILPTSLGIALRPYQWIGAMLLVALFLRFLSRRESFHAFHFTFFDVLLALIPIGSFIAASQSPSSADIRLSFVVASFYALYLLCRFFFQNREVFLPAISVVLGSATGVIGWGIVQNILFLSGAAQFSVMPGRPNATFPEADWFGLFLIILLALLFSLLRDSLDDDVYQSKDEGRTAKFVYFSSLILLSSIALILTVSRSAWLGALVLAMLLVMVVPFLISRPNARPWREALFTGNFIVAQTAIALLIVIGFHLTRFELFNRLESTASGMQRITVACERDVMLPEVITSVDDVTEYGCRHINLENIDTEKAGGAFVTTVLRPDPNVVIRKSIYVESWKLISERPLIGSGWTALGERLGTDERGASLNASNVFLELWIGSGLLGMAAFLLWLGLTVFTAVRALMRGHERHIALFLVLSLPAFLVFDLFNSGILLGFLWVLFALSSLLHSPYAAHRH